LNDLTENTSEAQSRPLQADRDIVDKPRSVRSTGSCGNTRCSRCRAVERSAWTLVLLTTGLQVWMLSR